MKLRILTAFLVAFAAILPISSAAQQGKNNTRVPGVTYSGMKTIINGIKAGNDPSVADVDHLLAYVENNADDYYKDMHPIYEKLSAGADSNTCARLAMKFDDRWGVCNMALRVLNDLNEEGKLSEEQQGRLKAYGEKYGQYFPENELVQAYME